MGMWLTHWLWWIWEVWQWTCLAKLFSFWNSVPRTGGMCHLGERTRIDSRSQTMKIRIWKGWSKLGHSQEPRTQGKKPRGDLETESKNLITDELTSMWIFLQALSHPLSHLSCTTTHVLGRSEIFICCIKKPRPVEVNWLDQHQRAN